MPPGIYDHTGKAGKFQKGHSVPKDWVDKGNEKRKEKHYSTRTEFQKGRIPKNKGDHSFGKGRIIPQEIRKKIGDSQKGDKHWNWQGGIACLPYTIDWTETLRKSIRERDHYVCKICLKNGWVIHHIDYEKSNCNPNNLITLCNKCHAKTNYKREYWKNYFKKL